MVDMTNELVTDVFAGVDDVSCADSAAVVVRCHVDMTEASLCPARLVENLLPALSLSRLLSGVEERCRTHTAVESVNLLVTKPLL